MAAAILMTKECGVLKVFNKSKIVILILDCIVLLVNY